MKLDKSKTWLFRVKTEEDGAAVFKHFDCPVNWDVCRWGVAKGLVWNPERHRVFHTPGGESLKKGIWVDVEKLKESLPRDPIVVEGELVEWGQQPFSGTLELSLKILEKVEPRCGPVRITIEEL